MGRRVEDRGKYVKEEGESKRKGERPGLTAEDG